VKDFIGAAANALDITLEWTGSGTDEKAINTKDGSLFVSIDKAFYRPREPVHLVGNPEKIAQELGWKPKTNFDELVQIMTLHDYNSLPKVP